MPKQIFSVSTQHYSFCGERVRGYNPAVWQQELRLYASRDPDLQIIHDVSQFRSEVGILYLSGENEYIMSKIIEQSGLRFDELFTAKPHVFISSETEEAPMKQRNT